MRLTEIRKNGGGSRFIIIPEGFDRNGWIHFAQIISTCCKGVGEKEMAGKNQSL